MISGKPSVHFIWHCTEKKKSKSYEAYMKTHDKELTANFRDFQQGETNDCDKIETTEANSGTLPLVLLSRQMSNTHFVTFFL